MPDGTRELPKPLCEGGYTYTQLREIIPPERWDHFGNWMRGQTAMICNGQKYNHETKEYEPACDGVGHGVVTYTWDVERYLLGLPWVD